MPAKEIKGQEEEASKIRISNTEHTNVLHPHLKNYPPQSKPEGVIGGYEKDFDQAWNDSLGSSVSLKILFGTKVDLHEKGDLNVVKVFDLYN